MTKTQILKRIGGTDLLALTLGVSRQTVWRFQEEIPEKYLWQLKGMRPDWFTEPKTSKKNKALNG